MANDAVTSLSTKVLRKSKAVRVKDTDAVLVFYQGTLMNGDEFDANFDFSTFEAVENRDPFAFTIGAGQVIEGWDKGLVGQRIGSVVELTIPADQAYGEAGSGESMCGHGEIDLGALRRTRRKPGMTNCLARQRLELFGQVYGGQPVYPANSLAGVEKIERSHFVSSLQNTIDDLAQRGII